MHKVVSPDNRRHEPGDVGDVKISILAWYDVAALLPSWVRHVYFHEVGLKMILVWTIRLHSCVGWVYNQSSIHLRYNVLLYHMSSIDILLANRQPQTLVARPAVSIFLPCVGIEC